MSIKVFKNLIVGDVNNTFKISMPLSQSLRLDQQHYHYYLKMLSVEYSLVDPNLFDGVNDTVIFRIENSVTSSYLNISYTFSEGLYDLADLVDIFNDLFLVAGTETYYCKMLYNQYTGKLSLKADLGVLTTAGYDTIKFTLSRDQNFMQNQILGFTQWTGLTGDVITLNSVTPEVVASGQPIIQSYNNWILSTNLTSAGGLTVDSTKTFVAASNVIMAFSVTGKPYSFKKNVAFTDLLFPIDITQVDEIVFELRGENGEVLNVSGSNKTDFLVQAAIMYQEKNTGY